MSSVLSQEDYPDRQHHLDSGQFIPIDVMEWGKPVGNLESATQAGLALAEATLEIERASAARIQETQVETDASPSRLRELTNKIKNIGPQLGMVAVAATTWGFEISPANEALRAHVGIDILQHTSNSLLVGGAVAGITMAVEGVTGLATAKTIAYEDGLVGRFNGWLSKKNESAISEEDVARKSDVVLGLAGGSTPVVIARHKRAGGRSYEENRKTALKAAAGIALFSGGLATVAGDVIEWAAETGHIEQASSIMGGLQSWRTWVGIFALMKAAEKSKEITSAVGQRLHKSEPVEVIAEDQIELDEDQLETVKRFSNLKKLALVGAVGAVAVGVPGDLLNVASDNGVIQHVGGWLADNNQVEQANSVVQSLWDWKIWTASFGATLVGSKLANRFAKKKEVVEAV